MSVSRRSFISGTVASAAAAGLVVAGGDATFAGGHRGRGRKPVNKAVAPDAHLTVKADDGKLLLPKGFEAKRITTINVEPLLDDRGGKQVGKTPSNLDGTASIDYRKFTRLIVNHECRADSDVPVPLVKGTVYDDGVPHGMGGNTVVEVTRDGDFVQQWVGLSGTIRNCAGGETAWGTWLSCEEDTTKAGTKVKSSVDGKEYTTKKDHGYVFEVFPERVRKQIPEPIKAWGRAVYEGATVTPDRTQAYLTEDTGEGLFYRWTAPKGRKIGPGVARRFNETDGILQAAQVVKNGNALKHYGELGPEDQGKPYPVKWIDGGADRQAQKSDLRKQFPGATVHPKIEGQASDGKGVYFALSYVNEKEATKYGIDQDYGMVMYYNYAHQTLTMIHYFPVGGYFDSPDNVTMTPWNTIVMSEDGSDPNHLIGWTPRRGIVALVKDTAERGEWAGPTFNKNGRVLYGSVQSDCTYALIGPWAKYLAN